MSYRIWAVVAVLIALGLIAVAIAGAIELDSGFVERRAAARLIGLAGLLCVPLGIVAVWSWRRGRYLSSLTPEYKSGLMKVRRGYEWFAETRDGRWMRWDPVLADWAPTSRPEDPALVPHPRLSAPPPPPRTVTAPEVDLALWSARREAAARRARWRNFGIVARIGGGLSLVLIALIFIVVIVGGIAAVARFLEDLPF
ncbi:MAG: hypothetical protein ACRDKT_17945 [Actinomycetota bacterium]